MKTRLMGVTAAALLAAATAAPTQAQTQSWGFGLHTGWFNSGSLGELKSNDDMDLKLKSGWTGGAGLEWWFGSRRVGLRFDGNYSKQPYRLVSGEHEGTWITNTTAGSGTTITPLDDLGRVDALFVDASLMLHLLKPTVDNHFAPFVSVGGGFARWNHEGKMDMSVPEADTYIQGDAQAEPVLNASLGADFFLTPNVALRAELKDYWNRESPYTFATSASDHQQGSNHQVASLGLQFMFGGERVSEPGFISVAPEPEPAPAPVVVEAPAPPPAPTTETVGMCVVDETGRLQMVDATRHLSDNQIYVTKDGQDVLFTTAYPATEPHYIKGAPWYVAARPLVLNLDKHDMGGDVDDELDDAAEKLPANRVEFVNFGATQPLPMGEVLFIGSIDGTPLYATRSDIGDMLPDLESRLRVTTDLDKVLDDEAFATRFANEIQTFYTVVEPGSANCVFQPMSSTHVFRRTRG